ncbi:restriction endonuclease [Bradyrhizobium sp. CCGUVB23]|uniref:restriction endonuclease n=1 Tax=Bradyrhizobium sp. CCGUVB23 TaxID=2949630 RepID=UPI0020B3B11B|nr:restriction endonuclease [Bradyrhizobium sp. CCGUVB23]MCP3462130.1 restriction endonuclease [Bradyrhizobium sp. CCGUVB23]
MAKTGRDLQRLIRAIEGARAAGQPIQIESPKRVRDKITGKLREHDVVLTITHEHHVIVVALECRDRSRPIGVDAVEAFRSKCGDTGIHSGVMVSSKGFTRTAIKKAAVYNIRCLSLDQVDGFDWCLPTSMTVLRREITSATLHVEFPQGVKLEDSVLYDENGTVIDKDRVRPIAQQTLNATPNIPSAAGIHNVRIHQNSPLIYILDGTHRLQASSCTLLLSYTVTREEVPFSFQVYSSASTEMPIAQAAVATAELAPGRHVDLVLCTEADGTVSITAVPNSTKPN